MATESPGLFRGTAWYYARYRPGYPDAFFRLVTDRFGLDGTGRLLDLGCGTGQLTLPLARRFAAVVGMDPEPEMLAEAEAAANTAGIRNITWVRGGSTDLSTLAPQLGTFRLVTIGSALHWMDQDATLRALAAMVEPGGGIVIAGNGGSVWNGTEPWQHAVKAVIQRWLGEDRRAGSGAYVDPPVRHEVIIARSPFTRLETYYLDDHRTYDTDQIIGHLYSTSYCSLALLGEKREPFERDVRQTLHAIKPGGQFSEDVSVEVFLAWKT
jgi:SAM-dependent methyltransferase